jgi:2-amino-4-hydroxy-6-hydroxymethyldihydropteridine diphosphokinase
VYLGLGSNLGARRQHLAHALLRLREIGRVSRMSGVYETDPEGFLDQPLFLNLVVRLGTTLGPRQLLERIRSIEAERSRIRTFRDAPRTLDIDILLFGDQSVEDEGLTVPHPRMTERAFVLVPLLELEPSIIEPGTGRPYADYLADLELERTEGDDGFPRVRRIMDGEDLLSVVDG